MRNVEAGAVIEKLINDNWVYNPDSKKNCTLLHGSGSNLHLHVQVHPETRKRVV
jgi:hypothetical protein